MTFQLGCELEYQLAERTGIIFCLEAARLPGQTVIREQLTTTPVTPRRSYTDAATGTRYAQISAPSGRLTLHYTADVDLHVVRAEPASIAETPVDDLPLSAFPYLLPSRFVPSDRLSDYALREFGRLPTGHARVTAICNWIHDNIDYRPGASDSETTADETLLQRAGVCRDFAHLGVAFCRALWIPARFVTCYALGLVPNDFHAVFEAYLSGRWWLFDPTRQAELDGLVRIGVGRDAAEVAFATPLGDVEFGPIRIWIEKGEGGAVGAERTTDAISNTEAAPLPTG